MWFIYFFLAKIYSPETTESNDHPVIHAHYVHSQHLSHTAQCTVQTHWGLISAFTKSVCQAWLVPVARGAPHAAMLCQQTALMPSICSVTYIKCMLLSLSPYSLNPPTLSSHVLVCVCQHLALSPAARDFWLTKVWYNAMIDCVKSVNFRITCDQSLTPLRFNTNWHFLGFNFQLIYNVSYWHDLLHTCKPTQSMCKWEGEKLSSGRSVGNLLVPRPALSPSSQKVLVLFMVTSWTGCDPTGVPVH